MVCFGGRNRGVSFDIQTERHNEVIRTMTALWERFGVDRDQTFIDQQTRYVDLHRPDGQPDLLQQIAHGTLNLVAQIENIGHPTRGIVVPNLHQFLFYVGCSTRAPEDRRVAVMEYITRANYGLRIGAFEFDYSDGEVRFRSAVDFEGGDLTDNLIRNTIAPAIHTVERYMGGLMQVMFGGASPREAIEAIEGVPQNALA